MSSENYPIRTNIRITPDREFIEDAVYGDNFDNLIASMPWRAGHNTNYHCVWVGLSQWRAVDANNYSINGKTVDFRIPVGSENVNGEITVNVYSDDEVF